MDQDDDDAEREQAALEAENAKLDDEQPSSLLGEGRCLQKSRPSSLVYL